MKKYFCIKLYKPVSLIIFLISSFSLKGDFLNAEFLFEESQIDSSTKTEDDNSDIPTNPFEIVEMINPIDYL